MSIFYSFTTKLKKMLQTNFVLIQPRSCAILFRTCSQHSRPVISDRGVGEGAQDNQDGGLRELKGTEMVCIGKFLREFFPGGVGGGYSLIRG